MQTRDTTGADLIDISGSIDIEIFDDEPAEVALTTFGDVINYSGPSAWGVFDQLGNMSGSLNSTVVRTGVGAYQVTFNTSMPSDDYAINCTAPVGVAAWANKSANGFVIYTVALSTGVATDYQGASFAVHATNALPPKGGTGTDSWATVDKTTSNGPCNVPASFNVASVTRTALGYFDVVFTTPMPTNAYSVTTGQNATGANAFSKTTNGFTVFVFGGDDLGIDREFNFQVNATNATLPSTITQEDADLILDTIKGAGVAQKVAILADEKPNGTDGGSAVVGWQDRTLNTVVSDEGNLVTFANDKEFTLKAGTYLIEWSAPVYKVDTHQTKLTNVTDGTTQEVGSSGYSGDIDSLPQSRSFGSTRVKITSDTTYKIEHYCERAQASNGLGINTKSGEPNIFTQVTITDLGVLAAGGGGGGGTTEIYGTAKAWGVIATDGTLQEETNIASVTKAGAGQYDVVFTKPFSNANYTVVQSTESTQRKASYSNSSTSGFSVFTVDLDGNNQDSWNSFAIFDNEPVTVSGGGGGGTVVNYSGASAWGSVAADGTLEGGIHCTTAAVTNGYQVNFTTPMPDTDYSVVASPAYQANPKVNVLVADKTTNSFNVFPVESSTGAVLTSGFNFAVHSANAITPPFTWKRDGTTLKPANDGDDVESTSVTAGAPWQSNNSVRIKGGTGVEARRDDTGTSVPVFRGYKGGSNTANATAVINNDGSATFAGSLESNGYLYANGPESYLVVERTGGTSTTPVAEFGGDTVTTRFTADGSATFAGNITAGNVSFNLEADDDTKYTATTDSEGNVTTVYNGEVLDVKALLLTLQTAASRIATLEAKVQTLEADHTTLMNNNNGGGY
jgi:hypothetical protein